MNSSLGQLAVLTYTVRDRGDLGMRAIWITPRTDKFGVRAITDRIRTMNQNKISHATRRERLFHVDNSWRISSLLKITPAAILDSAGGVIELGLRSRCTRNAKDNIDWKNGNISIASHSPHNAKLHVTDFEGSSFTTPFSVRVSRL